MGSNPDTIGNKMKKPKHVNIMGIKYKISYHDDITEVNTAGKEIAFGMSNCRNSTIRVYDGDMPKEGVFKELLHEIMEIQGYDMELTLGPEKHQELTALAAALSDTLIRNGWVKLEWD